MLHRQRRLLGREDGGEQEDFAVDAPLPQCHRVFQPGGGQGAHAALQQRPGELERVQAVAVALDHADQLYLSHLFADLRQIVHQAALVDQ